jgi:hypothetical protein
LNTLDRKATVTIEEGYPLNWRSTDRWTSGEAAEKFLADGRDRHISLFNGDCRIRVANCYGLRDKAYRFIYEIYQRLGYTSQRKSGMWLSAFDALPVTTTLIAENSKGDFCGVMTLVFDSPFGLPTDSVFKNQIDSLRKNGAYLCELISFGTTDNTRGSVKIIAGLFYCAYLLAWRAKQATHFVINVTQNHEKFYCRNLLFSRVGPVGHCQRAQGLPVVLLVLPFQLPNMLRNLCRIFPLSMLNYSDAQEMQIADQLLGMVSPMSKDEAHAFFNENMDRYETATNEQREILKKLYLSVFDGG